MKNRRSHFDALYAASPDPWKFKTSSYEQEKYRNTVRCLPRRRYRQTLEVGCSIGVLGKDLAKKSVSYLGVDLSTCAVRQARRHLRDVPGAKVRTAEVPSEWPSGRYDLVVLSEVLYFLSASELDRLAALVARDGAPRADCVLVNWLGETGTGLSGAEAAARFLGSLRAHRSATRIGGRTDVRYRLDVVRLA